jgi:transposase
VEESFSAGISVVEFARQRDLHPNLVHTWRWQARKGHFTESSNAGPGFTPVAVVAALDAAPSRADGPKEAAVIEVVLRNGRILRLPEHVAPAHAARFADVLEGFAR